MTGWDEHVADYLRLRRQLGFTLVWDEHLLGQFTRYLAATGAEKITVADAIRWAGLLPEGVTDRPVTRASTRLTAICGFATYLHALDPVHEVPPRGVFARRVQRPTPHIYTGAEVTALIGAAGRLPGEVRARTYPVLFGLLAATGLRIGEALAMGRDEADLETGVLAVSRGKSRDPRLVPLHPTTTAALGHYAAWRDGRDGRETEPGDRDTGFFTEQGGDRLAYLNVRYAFVQASTAAGLRTETQHPRMHDLRHTFAVNTLLGWYRDGANVAAKMPMLSTYLGHTDPANTYWYLSAVPELLAYAAARLDTLSTRGQAGS